MPEPEADEYEEIACSGPICIESIFWNEYNQNAFNKVVACLLLSAIQGRLPQWAVAYGDGRIGFARKKTLHRQLKVELLPRFLFEINWANTGPDFCWPEGYHLAYLPGFGRWAVCNLSLEELRAML
ncbi:MAG: hypothetical protein DIZ78_13930 [endosymbiont of Escarpia spicata]|uniref:Uncharacterized protein n=1 Tax=endosymbiont of Escarpia spicata TaxID=2200908 RepID=A0A370DFB7_9GAMM|nr:MAG: hypothetical protein DIZ78_13930 [endosymbiont of Escarpia spicata]